MNQPEKKVTDLTKRSTNVRAIADAIARGFPVEHAHVIGDLDAALEGHDASVAIPVILMVLENIVVGFEPAAKEQVANLMSEAAFRIAQGAREQQQAVAPEQAANPENAS